MLHQCNLVLGILLEVIIFLNQVELDQLIYLEHFLEDYPILVLFNREVQELEDKKDLCFINLHKEEILKQKLTRGVILKQQLQKIKHL